MNRVVIIGSGLSGLTSGVLLAEHGWSVTVLEAHALPGGLMQRFRRGPHWFDTGFHFITGGEEGGIFRRMAERLGILAQMRFLPLDQLAQFRMHYADQHFDVPVGLAACEAAWCRRWPEQAAGLSGFFAEIRAVMNASGWLLPNGTAPPATAEAGMPMSSEHRSVSTVLASHGIHAEPAACLGALCGIVAMQPEKCGFDLYASFAGTALCGSWRADGGGEAISDPLVERLRALGGQLLLRSAVTRIHWSERTIESVEDVNGVVHPCDLCISTCHPAETLRLTGSAGFRASYAERISSTPDSLSAFLTYTALSRPATELGQTHHLTYLKPCRPEAGQRGAITDGEGELYYIAPSEFENDGGRGDTGDRAPYLEAMLWLPCSDVAQWSESRRGDRPEAYEAWKRDLESQILERITEIHPRLAGTFQRTWSASPLSIAHYTRSRHGAAMGLCHDLGHLGSEPLTRRNRLKNLLLAGQSVGHPGVLGTMIGSFVLCSAILNKDLRAEVAALSGLTVR